MAASQAELSRELTSVTECTYPASLAKLADAAARADCLTVQRAINDRPLHAVEKLAAIVAASLPLWPFSLHLLRNLCQSPAFRDCLLLHNPGILNTLLTRASASQGDFDKYAELCVLLLSRPLPETVQLPEAAQQFFLSMFQRAVRTPAVESLRPIYSMLNGACYDLFKLLSADDRVRFDHELCQILSSRSGQDSMLLLWCFGIVLLAEGRHCEGIHGSITDFSDDVAVAKAHAAREWTTESGRKLLGSRTGMTKTLNLTYLSVIWAIKGDVGVSNIEAIEGITIAIRTLHSVDEDVRQNWPNSNELAKGVYPKLPAKVLRAGIHPTVQLKALCFYGMIAGEHHIPMELVSQYESLISNIPNVVTHTTELRQTLSSSLPVFAAQLRESVTRDMLRTLLKTTASPPLDMLSINTLTFIEALTAALPRSASLRRQVSTALSTNELQQDIQSFLQATSPPHIGSHGLKNETMAAWETRKIVSHAISMLLTMVFTAESGLPGLPQPLVLALLARQRQLSCIPNQRNFSGTIGKQPPVSLFEQECTPSVLATADWRDRLQAELDLQSSYQRDSLIRSVAQICQELESRCENVEEPLRRERDRVKELEDLTSQLHSQVTSLQSEIVDQKLYNDGLQAENSTLDIERERLSVRLQHLSTEITSANERAGETLRLAQDRFHTEEQDLRSTIIGYEETLLARRHELENFRAEVERLGGRVQRTESDNAALVKNGAELNGRLRETIQALEESQSKSTEEREVNLRLEKDLQQLQDRFQDATTELNVTNRTLEELRADHLALRQSSDEALKDLEMKYESSMELAAAKATEECDGVHEKLRVALSEQEQFKNANDVTVRELQASRKTIGNLEAKAQTLAASCAEKDAELLELRALKNNISVMMGLSATSALPLRNVPPVNFDSHAPKTPGRQHRRRKSAMQPETLQHSVSACTQVVTGTAMEAVADASFTSSDSSRNGPTPKRAKPRPTFKIPVMHTPYGQKATMATMPNLRKPSPTKRSALKAMSPNRRHTTAEFARSNNEDQNENGGFEKRRGILEGADQASIDMDGFTGGTPFTPGKFAFGTGRDPEEDGETTEL